MTFQKTSFEDDFNIRVFLFENITHQVAIFATIIANDAKYSKLDCVFKYCFILPTVQLLYCSHQYIWVQVYSIYIDRGIYLIRHLFYNRIYNLQIFSSKNFFHGPSWKVLDEPLIVAQWANSESIFAFRKISFISNKQNTITPYI